MKDKALSMHCCIHSVSAYWRKIHHVIFPKFTFKSLSIRIIIFFLFLLLVHWWTKKSRREAFFCQGPLPSYVYQPPRFGPQSYFSQYSELDRTPQNKSNFWVVYNLLTPSSLPKNNFLTLSTHVTTDFLTPEVGDLLKHWPDSPLSVAVTPSAGSLCLTLAVISWLWTCSPEIENLVSFHLLLNDKAVAEFLLEWPLLQVDCRSNLTKPLISTNNHSSEIHSGQPYWINAARNVARKASKTPYVLASDVELYPSPRLAQNFQFMIKNIELVKNRIVYVVPTFEIDISERDRLPQSRSALLNLFKSGKVVYFHARTCKVCQKFPKLNHWLSTEIIPGSSGLDKTVHVLDIVRREVPHHRWEPIYIGNNQEPWYDERLSWEGLQDKMTQMHELCLLKYDLAILDTAFLIHKPGIKKFPRKKEKTQQDAWRTPFVNNNSLVYDQVMSEMRAKYGKNPKCKEHF